MPVLTRFLIFAALASRFGMAPGFAFCKVCLGCMRNGSGPSRPRLLVDFRRDFRLGCEEFVLACSFTPRGNRWGCDFHSLDYQETEAVGRIDSTNRKPVFSSNRQFEYYSTCDCASSLAVRGTEATTSPAAGSDGDNQVFKYCFPQNSNRHRCRLVVGWCAVGKKK